jgi:hypothetical protein
VRRAFVASALGRVGALASVLGGLIGAPFDVGGGAGATTGAGSSAVGFGVGGCAIGVTIATFEGPDSCTSVVLEAFMGFISKAPAISPTETAAKPEMTMRSIGASRERAPMIGHTAQRGTWPFRREHFDPPITSSTPLSRRGGAPYMDETVVLPEMGVVGSMR